VDWEGRAAYNEMTGTLRDYRGRGLAFAAKLETVRWAAGKGLARILTGNDTRNAPMLAINDRLGYRPTIEVVEYVRDL
jgi:RimJ/RimL family protein N-acetyltransferase